MTSTEKTLEINVVDEIQALILNLFEYNVLYSCGHRKFFSSYALTVDGVKTEPIDKHGLCPDCCTNFIRERMDWCNECESWVIHESEVENTDSGSLCRVQEYYNVSGQEEPKVKTVVSILTIFTLSTCYHFPGEGAVSLARIKRRGQ